jgi:hypothetical protein
MSLLARRGSIPLYYVEPRLWNLLIDKGGGCIYHNGNCGGYLHKVVGFFLFCNSQFIIGCRSYMLLKITTIARCHK